jgi:hypothetical protein
MLLLLLLLLLRRRRHARLSLHARTLVELLSLLPTWIHVGPIVSLSQITLSVAKFLQVSTPDRGAETREGLRLVLIDRVIGRLSTNWQ